MKPTSLTTKKDGEIMIVHRCEKCGKVSNNRIAGDDNTDVIMALADDEMIDDIKIQLFGKR